MGNQNALWQQNQTSAYDLITWFRGSFASASLVAVGFGFLLLAILAGQMANTIKTKYLNHQPK